LAYQPPARSTFLSEKTSHQQPANNTFLSDQISTSRQPNQQAELKREKKKNSRGMQTPVTNTTVPVQI
jgi:hypothetical protein